MTDTHNGEEIFSLLDSIYVEYGLYGVLGAYIVYSILKENGLILALLKHRETMTAIKSRHKIAIKRIDAGIEKRRRNKRARKE